MNVLCPELILKICTQMKMGKGEFANTLFSHLFKILFAIIYLLFYLLILVKENKEEREKEKQTLICFSIYLMHSLVASFMCPYQGLNLQSWCIRTTLEPTELHGQGYFFVF